MAATSHCHGGLGALFWVDRPAAAQTEMVVKVYTCPAGTAGPLADQLREEFGMVPGVRVAADPRTSQVIVQAPPEIQARISQRLARSAPGGVASPAQKTAGVLLRSATVEQVETALWGMLGNRLSSLPPPRPQVRKYRLALAGGGSIDLTIDPACAAGDRRGYGPRNRRLYALDPGPGQSGRCRTVAIPG